MMTNSVQPEIDLILTYLQKQTGLNFSGNHASMIERRIKVRLSKTSQGSYLKYFEYLKQHPGELAELSDVLTINVTTFFRDAFTFEYFYRHLLPEIVVEKEKSRYASLRVWSAGCASGEEAYSMAILIKEYFEKEKLQIAPAIFATDIDQLALGSARAGVYKLKSVLNVKQAHLHKYFNTEVDRFELTPAIKDMVDFSTFDMLNDITAVPEESIFGGFDVVLCRNLLIYFEADFQEKIVEKLYHSLNKNGLLILGESERPVGAYRDRFKEVTTLCRIYRKLR